MSLDEKFFALVDLASAKYWRGGLPPEERDAATVATFLQIFVPPDSHEAVFAQFAAGLVLALNCARRSRAQWVN